jgi:hypothetical protein
MNVGSAPVQLQIVAMKAAGRQQLMQVQAVMDALDNARQIAAAGAGKGRNLDLRA